MDDTLPDPLHPPDPLPIDHGVDAKRLAADQAHETVDPLTGGEPEAAAAPTSHPLGYVLSLPERLLRSGTGLLGGALRESAALLVPQSFQSSRTYSVMVQQMLDFLVRDVGRVELEGPPSANDEVDHFVARKAVGNFVDMASLATLHVSPMLLLAVVSDIAYGSQAYLKELSAELKAQGVIAENSTIDHVNDLLHAVSDASAATSNVFNTPPLSVEALKTTIEETRAAVSSMNPSQVLPQAEMERMWEDMRSIARKEGVGLLAVSGAATMGALGGIANLGRGALSTVRVAGSLIDRHVLDHYARSLAEIRQRGLYPTLAETSKPYREAVWANFRSERPTLTQELLSGRLWAGMRHTMGKWLGHDDPPRVENSDP